MDYQHHGQAKDLDLKDATYQSQSSQFRSLSLGPQISEPHFGQEFSNQAKATTCSPNSGRFLMKPSPYIQGKHGSFHDQLFGVHHAQHVPESQIEQFPVFQPSPGYHGFSMNNVNSQHNMAPMMGPEVVKTNFDYSNGGAGLSQQNFGSQDQSMIANGGSFMSAIQDPNTPNINQQYSQTPMAGSFSGNGFGYVDASFQHPSNTQLVNPGTPVGSMYRSRKRPATPSSLHNSGVKRLHGESPLKSGYYSASSMIDADSIPTYISTKHEPRFQGPDTQISSSQATGNWIAQNSIQIPQMNRRVQGHFFDNTAPSAPQNTMNTQHGYHPTTIQMQTLNSAYGQFPNTSAPTGSALPAGSHQPGLLGDAIQFHDTPKRKVHSRPFDVDVKPRLHPEHSQLYNTKRREPQTEPAPRLSRKQGMLIKQPRRHSRDRRSVPAIDLHLRGVYTTPSYMRSPPQARRLKRDHTSPTLSNTSKHRRRGVSAHYSVERENRSKSRTPTNLRHGGARGRSHHPDATQHSSAKRAAQEKGQEESGEGVLAHEKPVTQLSQQSSSSVSTTPKHVTDISSNNETAPSTPGTVNTPLEVAIRRGYRESAKKRKKSQGLKITPKVQPSTPRTAGNKSDEPIDLCTPERSPGPIDSRPMKERITPTPKPRRKLGGSIFGHERILKKVAKEFGFDPAEFEKVAEEEKVEDEKLKEEKRQKDLASVIAKREVDAGIAEVFGASERSEDKRRESKEEEFKAHRAKSAELSKARKELAEERERNKLRLLQERKEKERLEKEQKAIIGAQRRAGQRETIKKAEQLEQENRRRRATQRIEEDRAKAEAQQAKELERRKATEVQVDTEMLEKLKNKQEELKKQSSNFKIPKLVAKDDAATGGGNGEDVEMASELFIEDKPAGTE
jgi:hypothetical protein